VAIPTIKALSRSLILKALASSGEIEDSLAQSRAGALTPLSEGAPTPPDSLVRQTSFQQIPASDFEELRLVASGAHGRVIECRIAGRPGKFAVKRVHGVGGEAMASMERELELLGSLRHTNIASLVGFAREPNGAVALVMELYDMSLAGLMRQRNGEVKDGLMDWFEGYEVLDWLLQIALGLRYLHDEVSPAVAHRDIKCDNCLVEMRGIADVHRVLLADFGIGKVIEESGTLTGQTMAGTPGYMAPEMLSGTYDPLKCDMYAFGILALALLCGVEPATMKMNFGQPLPFELTETAQERVDEDDAFGWLVEHVYRTCAACDASKRPSARSLVTTLQDPPI
jgi:LRR receptor-like serine/threonine-protein kinase ERECTA